MDFYEVEDIEKIIRRSARILQVDLPKPEAELIARSSRRTPRTANRILKRVRDYALVKNSGVINSVVVQDTLKLLTIDKLGLDEVDRKILRTLVTQFKGGPAGLSSLAAAISEERQTIEDVYEPYLIQEGFLQRTAQGRIATDKTYDHLRLASYKPKLFVS